MKMNLLKSLTDKVRDYNIPINVKDILFHQYMTLWQSQYIESKGGVKNVFEAYDHACNNAINWVTNNYGRNHSNKVNNNRT